MGDDLERRLRVVSFDDLSPRELQRWAQLQESDDALDKPYFHPRFTSAVAKTQPGVVVVIGIDADGVEQSFLPVSIKRKSATAAGYPAADFQGPICAKGYPFEPTAVMAACRVSTLRFDHLRDGVAGLERWNVADHISPFIDISGGSSAYLARASKTGRENFGQARRRARKIEREIGPLRFVANSEDPLLLDRVISLKRGQYKAAGVRDYFANAEHRDLVRTLATERGVEFSGMLSALFAGPHLVAAHFGLRRRGVLHWWFPVYDTEFSAYGPGWLMLRALIEAGPELNLNRIDLGRGEDEYKRRAMTGFETVHEAVVYNSAAKQWWESQRGSAVARLRTSRVGPWMVDTKHRARRLVSRSQSR